jgi:hypothetical protein
LRLQAVIRTAPQIENAIKLTAFYDARRDSAISSLSR